MTILVCCFYTQVQAQLKADFSIDNPGGCSPLVASFTNSSTGASASATYQWNFGNGNADGHTKDAKAIYSEEKKYTVTLTVRDGAQTATIKKDVTVYKKPTADFSFSPAKACAPAPITFTANASAGDGSISKYVWDFGDGSIDNQSNRVTSHAYTSAATPPVSLTVMNTHGCIAYVSKTGPVILPQLKADFDASATSLCSVGETVNFTNKSTGPGTLSYTWNFGGGKTATTTNASNAYPAKGNFDVILIAKSSEGCADTAKKAALITVANFNTDFNVPAVVCSNTQTEFVNNSNPYPNSSSWSIQGPVSNSFWGTNLNYNFTQEGTYKVTLTNTYGACTESKTKDVVIKKGPNITGFVADLNGVCGAPVTVKFKDTSATSVKWLWNFGTGNASTKEPSFTFNQDGHHYIRLTVTDAQGCVKEVGQQLSLAKPNISIVPTGSSSGCPGLKMSFATNVAANEIKKYEWIFGDGGSSTEANPSYVFNKAGVYTVKLKYTTQADCIGEANFYSVYVYEKPKADFSITSTNICGSSPAKFTNLTTPATVTDFNWNFGDGYFDWNHTPTHYYSAEGTYTITLIAGNGNCRDTMTKKDYVKVTPPFPKTAGHQMNCVNSGEVTFYQNHTTHYADKMWWDFGDGTVQEINPAAASVTYTYNATKKYKAYLIAERGACTVKDSITVDVLLKQTPVLQASLTEVCGSGNLDIKISGLEKSPADYYYNHYSIYSWQYADGSTATPSLINSQSPFVTDFTGTLTNLENGKSGIRVTVQSQTYPYCQFTSNIIPLDVKGPKAQFSYVTNNTCFKNPIIFRDESVPDDGVAIKKWEWNFSDGNNLQHTDFDYPANGHVPHLYANPGYYYPALTVTDADGCVGKTTYYSNSAIVKGPKAAFSYYPEKVFPGNYVYFYNNTNNANSSPQYQWSFTNGTPLSYNGAYPPSKIYNSIGRDSITLIAKDPSGCTDTAIQILYIKNVAASFTYKENYISNSSCPPVIIQFTSTSENAQRVFWDFGDGAVDDKNQSITNHTYYEPGEYKVVLYAYGNAPYMDSTVHYITIKGPYAVLKADTLSGCLNQTVTLSATIKNASSFTWDFGDGSLQQTTDTFATHHYTKAGVYTPAMVLKDGAGCTGTSEMREKIVIDSLAILGLRKSPLQICDSSLVLFAPEIKSIAAETMKQQLQYQWDYGTGASVQTLFSDTAYHFYNKLGGYRVRLAVSSTYGCSKQAEDSVWVIQTAHSTIAGPLQICQDGTALFTSTADMNAALQWNWDFKNGQKSTDQNPAAQLYTTATVAEPLRINLITEHKGCLDTAEHLLTVHKRPDVNLQPKQPVLCLGNSVQLTAGDGILYEWRAAPGLNQYNISNPVASPVDNTVYHVEVTNAFGCKRTDSTSITVAKPFEVRLPADTFVCFGKSVQLPATGAHSYQWIHTTTGLSSTVISAPFASPTSNSAYTVVGYDNYNCFTDTAATFVEVKALPWVIAPENMELSTGSEVRLPTKSSADALSWSWSPTDYLDCPACPDPTSRPRLDISYVVTVKNEFGCENMDTVAIKLVCAKSLVYIPNAFTPNNDQKNDVFYVKGRGIRAIKSMRIFNRWGQVVFETANVEIDDASKGWDGKFKGYDAEPAAYIYFVELICDTGEIFGNKGTVTLIR